MQQRTEELFVRALGQRRDIDNARGQQCGIGLWLGHFQQLHGALGDQFGLGCNQRPRCLQRNHRAHERRRLLVERTDRDGFAHLDQARDQRIAPGALRH
ncbi:hypothetical protein D3C75_942830 [compost metagenome]